MSLNIEREIYETDGALALKPGEYQKRPDLRLVAAAGNGEQPPQTASIISFTEFKLKRDQELFSQKLKLIPSAPALRDLRREVISITSQPKVEPKTIKPEIKVESTKTEAAQESEKSINAGPDLLKGTGFTPLEEMASLKSKYNEGIAKGENPQELLNRIVTENITNIRWYQWEYTMSDPILPNPVAQNETSELVNSKSGYSIVDMTNEEERDGSVKQSVVRTQELLKDAKDGDTVMIVSPPGWTARKEINGKEIKYPEAEIFAFIKGEGRNIRALTFISELTLEQCQQFKDYFVAPDPEALNKKQTEREKIMDMVANPIMMTGGKVKFEDILERVESIKGGEVMREANGANRTFKEAREFLSRGDELQKLPEICEGIIQTYETYLRENITNINDPNVYAAINQRMQLTVLEIAKTLKGDQKSDAPKEVSYFYQQAMASTNIIDSKIMQNNYDAQIAYLRTRPGCNGGGLSQESLTSFGSDLSQVLSGSKTFSSGISFSGPSSRETCKVCNIRSAVEGGCGFCDSCAAKM